MVFVHGLGGDAAATWRYGVEDSTSWPHRLGGEFPEVGVWSLGYPAAPTKWTRFLGWFCERWRDAGYSMALPDRAAQVLDLIVQRGLGRRPLLFICHSLGGLLVKQLLRKADDATEPQKRQVATNTRAVLFLATPHAGAELASLANAFRTVFGATVSIEDLSAHDAHLRDLFEWYRSHAVSLGNRDLPTISRRGASRACYRSSIPLPPILASAGTPWASMKTTCRLLSHVTPTASRSATLRANRSAMTSWRRVLPHRRRRNRHR